MSFRNFLFVAFAAMALCGCGIKRQSIRDTTSIPEGSGVIVARIIFVQKNAVGDEPVPALTAIKKTSLTVASLIWQLQPGESFSVMTLPAGAYTWRGLYVGRRYSEFRNLMPFEVHAGKINYVGDIVVSIDWSDLTHYGMHVSSDQATSENYLHNAYPQLSAHYPITASITEDAR
jgi:hypothetical protein